MAREFSVVVGINATKAVAGGRMFKAGADQVNRSNRGMQRSTARTTKRMTAMITTMGRFRGVASLMFAGFLGVGGIGSVIKTISQFETKISQVTALISAQSPRSLGGAMAALTDKARELGATTLFTATQAAEGMRFLSLAGFDALEVYQAIEPALILATVGMLDLGVAADIVSNIMAAFTIDASETEDVVNGLAFTASRTNTSIQQLGEAMKFVGPVAGALGVDVKETSVALGILGNSGLQASLAGTSLRRVMSGLLNPSKEAKKVFASMGVTQKELVDTMQGEQGLVRLVELLAKKGIDAADAFLLFGQRGAPGLLSLVNQRHKLRDLTEDLEKMGDIAREQARIIADNLGGDARIALSALQEVIIAIGKSGFGDWLREVTQSATGFFRELSGIPTPAEEMTKAMQKGATAAQFLRDNVDLLKTSLFIFVAFLNRQLLTTVALAIGRFVILGATVAGLAGPFAVASAGATLFAGAMNLVKAALISTGVGALVVGAGLLLQWALSSDEAAASAEELTEAIEEQRTEVDKLVFVFDLLDKSSRAIAQAEATVELERQQKALAELRTQMEGFAGAAVGIEVQQKAVAIAQANLNKEMEGTDAWHAAKERLDAQTLAFTTLGESINNAGYVKLKEDIAALEGSSDMLIEDIAAMKLVTAGLAVNMEAARDQIRGVAAEVADAEADFKNLTGILQEDSTAFRELVDEANPAAVAIAEVQEKMDLFEKVAGLTADQLEALKITEEDLAAVQAQLNTEMTAAEKILNDTQKAAKKLNDAREKQWEQLQDLRDGTKTVAALTRDYTRALAANALAVAAGTLKVEEFWEMQKILKGILEENIDELGNTCKKTKELENCMSDSAKAMQTLWDQALRNIQDTFAEAFRGAFDSSSEFFDKILDAFKDMISQMLAAWAVSGISNLFQGQSFGANGNSFSGIFTQGLQTIAGGGGTQGGGAGGVGGGGGGILGSVFGTGGPLEGVGTSMQTALGNLTAAAGAFGQGALAFVTGAGNAAAVGSGAVTSMPSVFNTGAQNAALANPGSFTAGGVAAGAGVGALTGAVADAILGGRGDPTRNAIFSAIGGAIGSIWGPIGSVVGGAIGSLVDNIFGGAKKLEKATLELGVAGTEFTGQTETIISKQRSFFRGKKYTTTIDNITNSLGAFEDLFSDFANGLVTKAAEFGGTTDFLDTFTNTLKANIKGKSEEEVKAILERFFNDTISKAIKAFVRDVEGLPERMLLTLSSFRNNTEEFIRAFESLGILENLFNIDLVQAGVDAKIESEKGLVDIYNDSLMAVRAVVDEYDGSISSLEALTQATAIFTQLQLDLIQVYQTVGAELSNLFGDSAQTIRESLLSEEELYNLRRSQIDDLVEQASNTTDPEELSRIGQELNRLGLDTFNMLDEDQREALGPEFIEFFEGIDELFGDQIAEGISSVVQDQADLDIQVATRMEEAAQAIIDAAVALENEARRRQDENEFRREIHR